MNLGNLRTLARAVVPQARSRAIVSATLDIILNEGALDVAHNLACLKVNTKFDADAEDGEYSLTSDVSSEILGIDRPGLWWNDTNRWWQLDPETLRSLDEKYPNWRDDGSGDPRRYAQDGDNLIIHPKPDTSTTNGFWLYHFNRGGSMTASGHFPFHITNDQTTEIAMLAPLSKLIIKYWEIHALHALGKKEESELERNVYKEMTGIERMLTNRRLDVPADSKMEMPRVN